jgi:phage terminase large subunit-like protein
VAGWEAYAAGSDLEDFENFATSYLKLWVDQWAGKPIVLQKFQRDIFGEALAYDEFGNPIWERVTACIPRKNGKTTMLAAYAVWRLTTSEGFPEILLAAVSDKQAGRLFDACAAFIRLSPELSSLCRIRDHEGEIVREDGFGQIIRMKSDPKSAQGYNPSDVIADEVGEWNTPSLKRFYAALMSGGAARRPRSFTITTAGDASERHDGILGRILDGAAAKCEPERDVALSIYRNFQGRSLIWNYEAPTRDARDFETLKLANPAPWVTSEFLRETADADGLAGPEILRYHGCVWTEGVDAWISPDAWDDCRDEELELRDRETVYVAVDVGLVHDSTSVAVAWRLSDGRVGVQTTVWAAKAEHAYDVLVPGGTMDLELIEEHIRNLGRRYKVAEVVYDPRFFERSAQILEKERFLVAPLHQSSSMMGDALQSFHDAIMEGKLAHAGGHVLAQHVMATAATRSDRGWKVSKMRQSQRIDATVAAAMAHWRASLAAPKQTRVLTSNPW